jgi:hypothetical protein
MSIRYIGIFIPLLCSPNMISTQPYPSTEYKLNDMSYHTISTPPRTHHKVTTDNYDNEPYNDYSEQESQQDAADQHSDTPALKNTVRIAAWCTLLAASVSFAAYFARQTHLPKTPPTQPPAAPVEELLCPICLEAQPDPDYVIHRAPRGNGNAVVEHRAHEGCIHDWAAHYRIMHGQEAPFQCPICNEYVPYPPGT